MRAPDFTTYSTKKIVLKKRFFFLMNKHRYYFVEIFFFSVIIRLDICRLRLKSRILNSQHMPWIFHRCLSPLSKLLIYLLYKDQTNTNKQKSGQWLECINNQTFLLNTLDYYLSWKNTFAIISVFVFRFRLPFYLYTPQQFSYLFLWC